MRLRILALGLIFGSGIVLAQRPATPDALPGPAATRPQTPPRDNQPPQGQTGSAVIKGRITAADTGRPLRRAHIVVSTFDVGVSSRHDATTDAEGRYEFTDLPAAHYSVSVLRTGFLGLFYGQRRPFEQRKLLDLATGQVLDHLDFALSRVSAIAGRVTDEVGEPIEGALVYAMHVEYVNGLRRIVPGSPSARSDDAGLYRVSGLMPGTYWVRATIAEKWTTTENGKREEMGYAPTFLPGVTSLAEAVGVTVGIGQQASVNDFSLVPGRAAKVSGVALDSSGRPLLGGNVGVSQETGTATTGITTASIGSATVAPDGSFVFASILPGEYKIRASIQWNREEAATQLLKVDGQDVEGIRLVTTAGWSIAGRVRTDAGATPGIARTAVSIGISLVSPELVVRTVGMTTNGQIRDDWTFAIANISGPARVQVTPPNGWAVKAVLQGDRDVLDQPLDMKSGEVLSDVEVVLTNRVTHVTGNLTDGKGDMTSDGTVVIFASLSDKWFPRSRWIRSVRPDQQGRYEVVGLPAGDYLAIAVDEVQDGAWFDPEYLTPLIAKSQKVTLRDDGQSVTVPLKLTSAQ